MVRVEEKDLFSPEREDNIFIVFQEPSCYLLNIKKMQTAMEIPSKAMKV